jgi:hypothetical protein
MNRVQAFLSRGIVPICAVVCTAHAQNITAGGMPTPSSARAWFARLSM